MNSCEKDHSCLQPGRAGLRGLTGATLGGWDQADAAFSSAAVPRVRLGRTTPPLCRCAECHADLIRCKLSGLNHSRPARCAAERLSRKRWCCWLLMSSCNPTQVIAEGAGVGGAAKSRRSEAGDIRGATHPGFLGSPTLGFCLLALRHRSGSAKALSQALLQSRREFCNSHQATP